MITRDYRRNVMVFCSLCLLGIAGCATQPVPNAGDTPGFFMGFLHGFIMLFSLAGSIFSDVRIYAFPNTGFGYDIGFFLGASAFLGGGATGAVSRKSGK